MKKEPATTSHPKSPDTQTCYGCGKRIEDPEKIIENERAVYCETCYRDRFFYHTTTGSKDMERM